MTTVDHTTEIYSDGVHVEFWALLEKVKTIIDRGIIDEHRNAPLFSIQLVECCLDGVQFSYVCDEREKQARRKERFCFRKGVRVSTESGEIRRNLALDRKRARKT